MVSVVVPCHNAAPYLAETLRAILDQSWRDLEIVLVDDGSTDEPGAIVASCADDRIRMQRIEASGGPSRPRNVAIAAARGRYVFFCDADDVMLPGKVERQVRVLEETPGLGLVFTNFQVIDARGAILVPSFLADYHTLWRIVAAGTGPDGGLDRERMVQGLLRANFIGTSSVAVRRDVLERAGGFDESLASSEDLDLWLRIARHHACGYVDMIGHSYRQHAASLMRERNVRHPLARIEVLRRQLDLAPDGHTRRTIERRIAANYCEVGFIHEFNGDPAGARANFLASLRNRPTVGAAWGWFKANTVGRVRASRHAAN